MDDAAGADVDADANAVDWWLDCCRSRVTSSKCDDLAGQLTAPASGEAAVVLVLVLVAVAPIIAVPGLTPTLSGDAWRRLESADDHWRLAQ